MRDRHMHCRRERRFARDEIHSSGASGGMAAITGATAGAAGSSTMASCAFWSWR